jgi:hypothetical protein
VQFYYVDGDFPTHDFHQKDRKEEKIGTVDVTFFSWCFLNHGLGLLQQNKK